MWCRLNLPCKASKMVPSSPPVATSITSSSAIFVNKFMRPNFVLQSSTEIIKKKEYFVYQQNSFCWKYTLLIIYIIKSDYKN